MADAEPKGLKGAAVNGSTAVAAAVRTVRPDFIPKTDYISPEITALERERLWPRVWQLACRVEDVKDKGQFVRYNVADQSIIIVNGGDAIRAFHNVCPHRGNQLVLTEEGKTPGFYCSFHGWRFGLDGGNQQIKDHEDWAGCDHMSREELGLSKVRTGIWGGFVFITMDENAEPLESYLDPIPSRLDCLELDKMIYKSAVTIRLKANWKTGITSFMESYHLHTTHPQFQPFLDDITVSHARGRHGNHELGLGRPFGAPSARTNLPWPCDIREGYVRGMGGFESPADRSGLSSDRSAEASLRVLSEVPAGTAPEEVHRRGAEIMREAAEAVGAGWPDISPKQAADMGILWNLFPNVSISFSPDAALIIRTRPDGNETASCLFDAWYLERHAPGRSLGVTKQYYASAEEALPHLPTLLAQDFKNIEQIQRGMNSIGFKGSRTNPVQERQVSNLHKVLHEYLWDEERDGS